MERLSKAADGGGAGEGQEDRHAGCFLEASQSAVPVSVCGMLAPIVCLAFVDMVGHSVD